MIPLLNRTPDPFRLALPDGSILLHTEQTVQAVKALAVPYLTCPCIESDLAIIDEDGKVLDDTQMPTKRARVIILPRVERAKRCYTKERVMTNKQQVTLQDGYGRTITTTAQTVEELKVIATEMVSRPGQEVIDLFMLDEVGNKVTNDQAPPQFVRIVPTLRTL